MRSIKTKIVSMIGIGMLLVLISIYGVVDYFYLKNVKMVAVEHLRESQDLFNEHLHFDTEKLTAVLEMFERDEEFKKVFLEGNRDKLFDKGQPLFKMLNEGYGITHFYFHMPDGTNFLRLHSRSLYGDKVTRETFKTAVVTGHVSTGIELGRTAFALRVVAPYYYKSKLIGYVEIGEEIDHFMDFLRRTKKEEFGILAEKSKLHKEEFLAINKLRGRQDFWDLMPKHVWIDPPLDKFMKSGYITEANIEQFEYEPAITSNITTTGSNELIFGGFPLNDVQRKHVGVVVALMDISKQVQALSEMKRISFGVLVVLFLLIFAGINYISGRWIINPIRNLADATRIFGRGDLKNHRVDYQSDDEIGQLADSINNMATQLDTLYSDTTCRSNELRQLNEKLESLAVTDGLTGLFNHRHLYTRLNEEINRAKRYGHPLSFIMIDIDNFKQYNDTFGHLNGDIMLKEFASTIMKHARDTDIIARYGGDEFAIILPETDLITALGVAERMREVFASGEYHVGASRPGGNSTSSFGVVALSDDKENDKGLVDRADKALYLAKQNGRNRVMTG